MKTNLTLLLLLFILFGMGMQACFTKRYQETDATPGNRHAAPLDTLRLEPATSEKGDTVEYELIIMDPGFDIWFIANRNSIDFYSDSYLETWNQILAMQWNSLHGRRLSAGCQPSFYLDYRSEVNYGKELNYQLFYYFRYADQKCRLFDSRPGRWR